MNAEENPEDLAASLPLQHSEAKTYLDRVVDNFVRDMVEAYRQFTPEYAHDETVYFATPTGETVDVTLINHIEPVIAEKSVAKRALESILFWRKRPEAEAAPEPGGIYGVRFPVDDPETYIAMLATRLDGRSSLYAVRHRYEEDSLSAIELLTGMKKADYVEMAHGRLTFGMPRLIEDVHADIQSGPQGVVEGPEAEKTYTTAEKFLASLDITAAELADSNFQGAEHDLADFIDSESAPISRAVLRVGKVSFDNAHNVLFRRVDLGVLFEPGSLDDVPGVPAGALIAINIEREYTLGTAETQKTAVWFCRDNESDSEAPPLSVLALEPGVRTYLTQLIQRGLRPH